MDDLTARLAIWLLRRLNATHVEGGEVVSADDTGIVRIDSWKVVCDECRQDFESSNDWSIFADRWYAEECASDADWLIRPGLVVCPSCWEEKPFCRDEDNKCARRDVSEADDGWLYCPDHIEQGMDAPAEQVTS